MRIRWILGLTVVTLAVTMGMGTAVSSGDQGAPYKSFGVTVRPSSPTPGGAADITAAGYRPGSTATFWISGSSSDRGRSYQPRLIELGGSRVDANGVVNEDVTVPASFQPRSIHIVVVKGEGRDGRPLTESTSVVLSQRRNR